MAAIGRELEPVEGFVDAFGRERAAAVLDLGDAARHLVGLRQQLLEPRIGRFGLARLVEQRAVVAVALVAQRGQLAAAAQVGCEPARGTRIPGAGAGRELLVVRCHRRTGWR